jgi:hypothetical protein
VGWNIWILIHTPQKFHNIENRWWPTVLSSSLLQIKFEWLHKPALFYILFSKAKLTAGWEESSYLQFWMDQSESICGTYFKYTLLIQTYTYTATESPFEKSRSLCNPLTFIIMIIVVSYEQLFPLLKLLYKFKHTMIQMVFCMREFNNMYSPAIHISIQFHLIIFDMKCTDWKRTERTKVSSIFVGDTSCITDIELKETETHTIKDFATSPQLTREVL